MESPRPILEAPSSEPMVLKASPEPIQDKKCYAPRNEPVLKQIEITLGPEKEESSGKAKRDDKDFSKQDLSAIEIRDETLLEAEPADDMLDESYICVDCGEVI